MFSSPGRVLGMPRTRMHFRHRASLVERSYIVSLTVSRCLYNRGSWRATVWCRDSQWAKNKQIKININKDVNILICILYVYLYIFVYMYICICVYIYIRENLYHTLCLFYTRTFALGGADGWREKGTEGRRS